MDNTFYLANGIKILRFWKINKINDREQFIHFDGDMFEGEYKEKFAHGTLDPYFFNLKIN